MFEGYSGFCLKDAPDQVHNGSLADCCDTASSQKYTRFVYNTTSAECALFRTEGARYVECGNDTIMGHYDPDQIKPCDCERVFKAVGRENITEVFSGRWGSNYPLGGEWYSHPTAGECTGEQRLGDDSGCTYRVLETTRAINASCMYQVYDASIESYNPDCFASCPQPHNVTSTCYLGCYSKTTKAATKDQLVRPWTDAFDTKCPEVDSPQRLVKARAWRSVV